MGRVAAYLRKAWEARTWSSGLCGDGTVGDGKLRRDPQGTEHISEVAESRGEGIRGSGAGLGRVEGLGVRLR